MINQELDRRTMLAAGGMIGVAAVAAVAGRAAASADPRQTPANIEFGGRIPVAFVMGPGSTMIDFAGPWEVFQDAQKGDGQAFYLYTVSDSTDEIHTTGNFIDNKASGLRFRPDFSFANAPQPGVIMMGAQGGHSDAKIAWIRQA